MTEELIKSLILKTSLSLLARERLQREFQLCYKPIEYEEIVYEKPDVIMEKVLKYESEIAKDISEIKKYLGK